MIVTIILTASYIGDDVASYRMHWLYAMQYFSVTDGQGDSRSRIYIMNFGLGAKEGGRGPAPVRLNCSVLIRHNNRMCPQLSQRLAIYSFYNIQFGFQGGRSFMFLCLVLWSLNTLIMFSTSPPCGSRPSSPHHHPAHHLQTQVFGVPGAQL